MAVSVLTTFVQFAQECCIFNSRKKNTHLEKQSSFFCNKNDRSDNQQVNPV